MSQLQWLLPSEATCERPIAFPFHSLLQMHPSIPETQRLPWVDPSQPNASQDSLRTSDKPFFQRCNGETSNHRERRDIDHASSQPHSRGTKTFVLCPTSASLLGSSNKGGTSLWWILCRLISVLFSSSRDPWRRSSPRAGWTTSSQILSPA